MREASAKQSVEYPARWQPQIGSSFAWQLTDYPVDPQTQADIIDIDLFETSQSIINNLHSQGKKVICYINAGAWEAYRPDADAFPAAVVGRAYIGWPDERWLDVSRFDQFSSLMAARFDLAKDKGCDGLELDNIDGYQQKTGFTITQHDQAVYSAWLAHQAHTRGLAVALKNCPEMVAELVEHFDFAIIEECTRYGWCADFKPFTEAHKPVFQVSYEKAPAKIERICAQASLDGFYVLFKNRSLDNWSLTCES